MEPRQSLSEPTQDRDAMSAFAPFPSSSRSRAACPSRRPSGPARDETRVGDAAASCRSSRRRCCRPSWPRPPRRSSSSARSRPAAPARRPLPTVPATATTASTASTALRVLDLTDVVAVARASVVTITADGLSTRGFSPFGQQVQGVGSGIVITSNGYILTNRHVVSGSQSLTVQLARRQELSRDDRPDGHGQRPRADQGRRDRPRRRLHRELRGARGRPDRDRDRQPARDVHRDGHPGDRLRARARGDRQGRAVTGRRRRSRTSSRPMPRSTPATAAARSSMPAGNVIGINTAVSTTAQGLGFAIPIDAAKDLISLANAGQVS